MLLEMQVVLCVLSRHGLSINKLGGDAKLPELGYLSCFDRSVIKDPYGLAEKSWSKIKGSNIYPISEAPEYNASVDLDKVRATHAVTLDDVQKLKTLVLKRMPASVHISAFAVACAYVWTCLLKSQASAISKEDDDKTNEAEYFCFAADCRARLKQPVPDNYFGNCIAPCVVNAGRAELMGEEGFIVAAAVVGEAIDKMVRNEGGISEVVQSWRKMYDAVNEKDAFGVSGSPKFDAYEVDYGWGKPEKFEIVSIDHDLSMSLSKSRKSEGGLEVGLSLSTVQMHAFREIS